MLISDGDGDVEFYQFVTMKIMKYDQEDEFYNN